MGCPLDGRQSAGAMPFFSWCWKRRNNASTASLLATQEEETLSEGADATAAVKSKPGSQLEPTRAKKSKSGSGSSGALGSEDGSSDLSPWTSSKRLTLRRLGVIRESLSQKYEGHFNFKPGYEKEFKTLRMLGRGAFGSVFLAARRSAPKSADGGREVFAVKRVKKGTPPPDRNPNFTPFIFCSSHWGASAATERPLGLDHQPPSLFLALVLPFSNGQTADKKLTIS